MIDDVKMIADLESKGFIKSEWSDKNHPADKEETLRFVELNKPLGDTGARIIATFAYEKIGGKLQLIEHGSELWLPDDGLSLGSPDLGRMQQIEEILAKPKKRIKNKTDPMRKRKPESGPEAYVLVAVTYDYHRFQENHGVFTSIKAAKNYAKSQNGAIDIHCYDENAEPTLDIQESPHWCIQRFGLA